MSERMLEMVTKVDISKYVSIFSQFYHWTAFASRKPKMRLENGVLITSIDIDVGSKEVGLINKGKNDVNVSDFHSEYDLGKIEEQAFPLFLDFFNSLEIPVTFALRGQSTEVSAPVPDSLLESNSKHDIGAHGYSHRIFTELSATEAESELKMTALGMKKRGIVPKSFVFPKNKVAHLSLLEKHGYKCYRSSGDFRTDSMHVEKHGQLYDIHPSFYIGQSINPIFLRKILDLAVVRKLPFHVWFHLWNFGESPSLIQKGIKNVLFPLYSYAKKKEKMGILTFETMLSTTERVEALSIARV
jgi:peptidoglycan/xylan/chitin deacetylase (PgdA/CDA1 family)